MQQSTEGDVEGHYEDPLTALGTVLDNFRSATIDGLPKFTGGAVGYLSYDAIRRFEPRVGMATGPGLGYPEAHSTSRIRLSFSTTSTA